MSEVAKFFAEVRDNIDRLRADALGRTGRGPGSANGPRSGPWTFFFFFFFSARRPTLSSI